ncbi:transposable element Tcb2 transposase [Trichonephila clavipes]|nr:transposable element Tcb2 transposase [Trichonephila clavipes]
MMTADQSNTVDVQQRLMKIDIKRKRRSSCSLTNVKCTVTLTSKHRCVHREWATVFENLRRNKWRDIPFFGESHFSVHPDNRGMFIWRECGTKNNPAFVHGNVRLCGGAMMVYTGISIDRRTGLLYKDEILRPIVIPYAATIRNDFMLIDDYCKPLCANLVDDLFFEKGIVRMK